VVIEQYADAGKAVVGLVVDTVDQMMHGMVLGKAGMVKKSGIGLRMENGIS
jgi:hypothetical protein